MPAARNRFILFAVLGYLLLASAWVVFSDRILLGFSEVVAVAKLSTLKGLIFVLLSGILLALALHAVPQRQAQLPLTIKHKPWALLAVFVLFFAIIAGMGGLVFHAQSNLIRQEVFAELRAVARLKTEAVGRWLEERRSDVQEAGSNPVTVSMLARWVARGGGAEQDMLLGTLRNWKVSHGYDQAMVLNAAGEVVLADGKAWDSRAVRQAAGEAMRNRTTVLVDLHQQGPDEEVHLGFVAPLIDPRGKVFGALYLGCRPYGYLYPYLRDWPYSLHTGETVLVRKDGENVLYLNESEHLHHRALTFRLPRQQADQPSVKAVFGGETTMEGRDYRGKEVLAVAEPVPGTSWMMIAKADTENLFAQIIRLTLASLAFKLVALFLAVGLIFFLWQRQQLRASLAEVALSGDLLESERRGRFALDVAALGVWRHDLASGLLHVDKRARRHFCCEDDVLPLEKGMAHVHPDDRQGLEQAIAAFQASGSEQSMRLEFRTMDSVGLVRHVETIAQIHFGGEGEARHAEYVYGVSRDVTRQRMSEETLRRSEQKLSTLFRTMKQGVVYQAADGTIIDANPAAERIFGLSLAQLQALPTGGRQCQAIREDGRELGCEDIPAMVALRTGAEVRNVTLGIRNAANGEIRWANVNATPLFASGASTPDLVYSTIDDVSESKRARDALERSRAELRALNAQAQSVREAERGRIAREIHDELGQALTALKMDLALLKGGLTPEQSALAQKTDDMAQVIRETVVAVRRISQELRPSILDTLGIVAAIEWQVSEFRKRMGIRCNTVLPGDALELPDDMKTNVFRIGQELLTNVSRHAGATRVDVTLTDSEGWLVLTVADNGKGMEPRGADCMSFGLVGIRERAAQMGGTVEIQTVPTITGTRVSVRIPLTAAAK